MEENKKYYTSSDGKKTPIEEIEFTHLCNGLAKKYREVFEATTKKEFSDKIGEISIIKEEIHKRINDFNERLDD